MGFCPPSLRLLWVLACSPQVARGSLRSFAGPMLFCLRLCAFISACALMMLLILRFSCLYAAYNSPAASVPPYWPYGRWLAAGRSPVLRGYRCPLSGVSMPAGLLGRWPQQCPKTASFFDFRCLLVLKTSSAS